MRPALLAASLWLLLSPPHLVAQEPPSSIPAPPPTAVAEIGGFTEGLWTRNRENSIPDSALVEALNVLVDEDAPGVIVRREGATRCNASALPQAKTIRGLWQHDAPDGTRYQVALSSEQFFQHDGDCDWSPITGLNGIASDVDTQCVSYLSRFWCLGQGETLFYWDPTASQTTHTVTGAPAGELIDGHRNRIVIADVASNQSRFYLSGELDGTDWTVPSDVNLKSTSPAIIAIGGVNEGNKIRCLMGTYADTYLIGKQQGLYGLYGFDTRDFKVRELSREVGCIDDNTVREKNNAVYWLSTRGVERMRGATIERVSEPVRNLTDTIIAAAGNLRAAIDTSQADFEAGTLTAAGAGAPMSATISPANVVGTTWTVVETSSSDFVNGTTTLVSTSVIVGSLVSRNIIESATWTLSGSNGEVSRIAATNCSYWSGGVLRYLPGSGGTPSPATTVEVLDAADNSVLYRTTTTASSCTNYAIDTSTQWGKNFRLRLTNGADDTLTSTDFEKVDEVIFTAYESAIFGGGTNIRIEFPDPFYKRTSTYTSKTYDMGFATATYGIFIPTHTAHGAGSLSYAISVSSDSNDTFDAYVAVDTNTAPTAARKRYLRMQAYFTTTKATATPRLDEWGLAAGTTGQFISQCRNPGTAITSWDRLTCDFTNFAGSWSVAVATGSTCNAATRSTATWNAHTNASVISIATAPFVAYRLTNSYSVFYGTTNPLAHSCQIEWNEGETRPPLSAEVHLDRYHLAYTTDTASGAKNDHILVLDRNDKWVLWDNLDCYSLGLYERRLYCGDSADSGLIYRLYNGASDDGAAFTSRFRTKAYAFGGPHRRTEYLRFGAELEPEPDTSYDISGAFRYYLDRSTTSVSIGPVDMGEDPGHLLWADMPFPAASSVEGRYLQLEGQVSGTNTPFRFYRGLLQYRPLRED